MGEKVLKKARKIELLLTRGQCIEKGLLKKGENPFVCKKITKQESGKKHEKAPHQAGLKFI